MDINIRPLLEKDLSAASSIIRLAFGTFIGAPSPEQFRSDKEYAVTRWNADPYSAFVAEVDGEIAGSNFAARWGSIGFFGPLSVHPDLWDQGIGSMLMRPVMELFESWNIVLSGLFTFPNSPKHVGLYQKYGFWPGTLTAVMSKPVSKIGCDLHWTKYSDVRENEKQGIVDACYVVTDTVYPGLDVEMEIRSVHKQRLGDTILLWDGNELAGFAVCHCGSGTEAGKEKCYVKFGAVKKGVNSGKFFNGLLDACEVLAFDQEMLFIEAGINTARHNAYREMLKRGFCIDITGIIMHRPCNTGYDNADVYLLDDWR